MTVRKMNVFLSLCASFCAVQGGALVVCIGIMILDSGPTATLEGAAVWVIAQPIILPFALLSAPFGVLLRMVLGLTFAHPRPVALITGTCVGAIGAVFFAYSTKVGLSAWLSTLPIGSIAGAVGGWIWWRIEKPFLEPQKT